MVPAVAASATLAVFLCLAVAYSILAIVGVYRKREEFPFNGREFSLIIPQGIGILTTIVYFPIVGLLERVPCTIVLVLEVHVFSMGLGALMLRCLRWMFLHFASQALMKRHTKRHSSISTWFVDHRHYVTPRFLLKVLLGWSLFVVTTTSLLSAFMPADMWFSIGAPLDCPTLCIPFLLARAAAAMCLVALIATAWRLRGVDDAYQIKQEIMYLVISAILYFVSNNIRRTLPMDPSSAAAAGTLLPQRLMRVAESACWCLALYAIAWFPLSVAHKDARAQRRNRGRKGSKASSRGRFASVQLQDSTDESTSNIPTERRKASAARGGHSGAMSVQNIYSLSLRVLLIDETFEKLRVDFERHLAAEFAFENLLFWADSGYFIECFDDRSTEETARHAVQLYNDFVRQKSSYQANFNSAEQKAIREALEPVLLAYESNNPEFDVAGHISKNVFDSARATVYRLMSQGAYIRWQSKSANLVKEFLKNRKVSNEVTSATSPCGSTNSLAYYKSIVSGPSSLRRDKCAPNGGESVAPQSPSTASPNSREHMLASYHHSRGQSDGSSTQFAELGELPPSPSASRHATASSHHRRVNSNASSLGMSETSTYFNFQNVPRSEPLHDQSEQLGTRDASTAAEV